MGSWKDFFKIWTKRNNAARKLPYISLMGTTTDLYEAKEEKESAVASDTCNLFFSQQERGFEWCNPRLEQKTKKSPQQGQKTR